MSSFSTNRGQLYSLYFERLWDTCNTVLYLSKTKNHKFSKLRQMAREMKVEIDGILTKKRREDEL